MWVGNLMLLLIRNLVKLLRLGRTSASVGEDLGRASTGVGEDLGRAFVSVGEDLGGTSSAAAAASDIPEVGSDCESETKASDDSDNADLFDEGEDEYGSDVHEKVINLRKENRAAKIKKRKEKGPRSEGVDLGKKKITNMKIWPQSTNPFVIPPVIKTLPGRPRKCTRKEQNENKTRKLSKRGVEMTCNLCHAKSHNKRGCHLNNQANACRGRGKRRRCETSSTRSSVGSSRAPTELQSSTKIGRGRPRGSTKQASATRRGRGTATGNGTGIGVAVDGSGATGRGRVTGLAERGGGTAIGVAGRGRGAATGVAGRGRGIGVAATATDVPGATRRGKRPRMPRMPMNSSIVTGNLGHHKPRSGLKWKGKTVVTQ
ncbi:hypothetical protein H5410_026895 [Solanum commersonii]|uniref:Uncharacterized protein n=1 Tax=Solanum commersonii TaxID=4109 RepID=A0A9J5YXH0_SOLCO|nr:hypothetical protein H5410_026895 [Solanum commersonii]